MQLVQRARNNLAAFMVFSLMLLIGGCAGFDVKPKTFNESVAVSLSAVDEVRSQTIGLLKADKITSADGENVLKMTDTAQEGIVVARALSATDLNAGTVRLETVRASIAALQQYLILKGATK